MAFLILAGVVAGVAGILFLFAPKMLDDISGSMNKIILSLDEKVKGARVPMGILLCIASIFCFMAFFKATR